MNIYTHLNVPVYDEFLRSVILGSEARWRSFHDAHILADKWFHEFNEKWAADSRVVATSKDEHVAALRLLNLYCFHWCKRVARIPAKLYREDYLPSGQAVKGKSLLWMPTGKSVSSWSMKKFRHRPAIRLEKESSIGRDKPALLLSMNSPSPSQTVWMHTGRHTTIQAEYYVMDLHTAATKHAKGVKNPDPYVKRLEKLEYALYHLNNRFREYSHEQEVILYTPKPIKVTVEEVDW